MEDKALGKEFYSRKSMEIPGKKSFDWANPGLNEKFEDRQNLQKSKPGFYRPDENGESLHYAASPERMIEKNNSFRRTIGLDEPKTKDELGSFINEQEKRSMVDGEKVTREKLLEADPRDKEKYDQILKARRAGIKAEDAKAERDNEMKVAFDLMGLKGPKYGE